MSRLEHVLMLLCLLFTILLLMCFLTGCVNQETKIKRQKPHYSTPMLLLMCLLTGCVNQDTKATIFYTNGDCVFFIDGVTLAQSDELLRKWDFEECDVEINSNVN